MDRLSYEISAREDGASILKLKGMLTIQEACELKQILREALQNSNQLVVDCSGAEKMDFAWLQLLCAAHRSARAESKEFSVSEPFPEALHAIKAEAGFDRHCGCPMSGGVDNCVWVGIGYDK